MVAAQRVEIAAWTFEVAVGASVVVAGAGTAVGAAGTVAGAAGTFVAGTVVGVLVGTDTPGGPAAVGTSNPVCTGWAAGSGRDVEVAANTELAHSTPPVSSAASR